jgi:hypothetical protein
LAEFSLVAEAAAPDPDPDPDPLIVNNKNLIKNNQ